MEVNLYSKKVLIQKLLLCMLVVITYLLFDKIYEIDVSPNYSYMGLGFREKELIDNIVVIFFLILPINYLPINARRPSNLGIWLMYLIPYFSIICMGFNLELLQFETTLILFILAFIALQTMNIFRRLRFTVHPIVIDPRDERSLRVSRSQLILWLILFFVIDFYLIYIGNFNFDLSLDNVYSRRFEARGEINTIGKYIIGMSKAFVVVYCIYFIWAKRKIVFIVPLLFFILAVFSIQGTKSIVLLPVLLFSVLFFSKKNYVYLWLLICIVALMVIALLEIHYLESGVISEKFIRRIWAVSGYLSTSYFDFFTQNEFVYLTDSFVGRFFSSPTYDYPLPYVIGEHYVKHQSENMLNANTGIWLSGFAQFGVFGLIISSAIGGFIFGIVDRLTRTKHYLLGVLICSYMAIIWSEQQIQTSALTGGVALLIISLLFIKKATYADPKTA